MSAYAALDNASLIGLIRSGNHDAFAELVTRHTDRFYGLAYRTLQNRPDAEDVVQAAFIKLWERPHLWNKDKSRFTTWFYRVIINACYDHARKSSRTVNEDDSSIEYSLSSVKSVEATLEGEQEESRLQYCLEEGLRRLPDSQRNAINLVVYSNLPQKQAAEVLGISLKALESLLVRAKKSLAKTASSLQEELPSSERRYAK